MNITDKTNRLNRNEILENGIHVINVPKDIIEKHTYWCPECNFNHIKEESYVELDTRSTDELLTKLGL